MVVKTRIFSRTMLICAFIFVWLSFPIPVIAEGDNYYVSSGGSNTSPYDSWAKAAHSIQTAVDEAGSGDIVNVADGTYTENVDVGKKLTLQSENGNSTTTVVASSSGDHVFDVTADYVEINGFSIYGATDANMAGIYVNSVTNCAIKNNRCGWDASHGNTRGIHLEASSSCNLTGNVCSYNSGEGILLRTASNSNTLSSNTVNNNGSDGISFDNSSGNTVSGNTANSNTWDGFRLGPSSNNSLTNNTAGSNGDHGILIASSSGNSLTGNTFSDNTGVGIHLSGCTDHTISGNTANWDAVGIKLEANSSGNELTSNTVTHNEFGIFLSGSDDNTITSNTMNENDGRSDGDGIMLTGSDRNSINNNTANNNPGDGIEFYESCNNTVKGNTLDTGSLADPGASMRINYYSCYNTIVDNTVIDGSVGIVLEEASNHNTVANNTVTGHSQRGIEFYEQASYNIITRNTISNNDVYGVWLPSVDLPQGPAGLYNSIYLNDFSNNTTAHIFSEMTTTTWNAPTKIYYDYNSGTFNKDYLGNYYSDGTHTGSNGLGGTYSITNDNDDDYQLIQTSSNYALQAWWLGGDNKMYRDDVSQSGGTVFISGSASQIWIASQAALQDIAFSGSDTWAGQLVFGPAPTNGHTFTVELGSSTDGNDFTAGGPDATVTGDGSNSCFSYATDASAFTVSSGKYLALRITNNNAGSDYDVQAGGAWSYCSSPDASTDYSLPVELNTFTATLQSGAVLLKWCTESETENLGFIVERRMDDSWQELASYRENGTLEGAGSSSQRHCYQYLDQAVIPNVSYQYRLADVSYCGEIKYHPAITIATEELVNSTTTESFQLYRAYPNPFNPSTTISYRLPQASEVTLRLYDTNGNLVDVLVSEQQSPGTHRLNWYPSRLSSGVYYCRMQAGAFTQTQKLVFLK